MCGDWRRSWGERAVLLSFVEGRPGTGELSGVGGRARRHTGSWYGPRPFELESVCCVPLAGGRLRLRCRRDRPRMRMDSEVALVYDPLGLGLGLRDVELHVFLVGISRCDGGSRLGCRGGRRGACNGLRFVVTGPVATVAACVELGPEAATVLCLAHCAGSCDVGHRNCRDGCLGSGCLARLRG